MFLFILIEIHKIQEIITINKILYKKYKKKIVFSELRLKLLLNRTIKTKTSKLATSFPKSDYGIAFMEYSFIGIKGGINLEY